MEKFFEHLPPGISHIEKRYEKGRTILGPAEKGGHLYILKRGTASVYNLGLEGEELKIFDYRPGEYFGEVELLCGRRYPLLVKAKTACTVWLVRGEDFLHWLRESPEFSLFIMKSLCEKLLYNSDRLTRISLLSMRERFLLSIYTYEQSGRLPCLSKTQLAEDICAPIRSLNRLIAENTALVRYGNRAFSVVDRERLASLCAEIQAVLWQQAD